MTDATEIRALRTLVDIVESGRPLAYIHSPEEQRVRALLRETARTCFSAAVPLWIWSLTEGMRRDDGTGVEQLGPRAALDFVATYDGAALFLFEDFHEPMREAPDIRRRLRDLYELCLDRGKFLLICSPVKFIPEEIERSIAYVELAVPDLLELVGFLRREAPAITAAGGSLDATEATLFQLGRALQGLTLDEVRHAIRRALTTRPVLDQESIPTLLEEKRMLVNRTGMIEYIPSETTIEHVGGLEIMKKWLMERRKLFQMRDRISAEIEPGINTQAKEGELSRIFGFFLTWMQEKTRGLFVGATANRIDLLPAEMIRKGRFDEVFFVDLPLEDERLEIFRVHLRRRGIDFSDFDLVPLKTFTKGWTGAEIEQCVVSALTTARLKERQLTGEDLLNATANVVPLSKTMKEQVDHIRKWAFDRAVRASPREFGR